MKFSYDLFNSVLEWNNNVIPVIVVENKPTYRTLIKDLTTYQPKKVSDIRILKDTMNEISSFQFINIPVLLEFNNTSINKYLTNFLIDEMNDDYQTKLKIENDLREILFDVFSKVDIQVEISDQMDIKQLMKLFKINVIDDSSSDIESLINYIELMITISPSTLFGFAGLKTFFTEIEIQELYKYLMMNEINCLLVENRNMEMMYEKIFIIDDDLCEIY